MSYIEKSKFLPSPQMKEFALSLVTNQIGPLALRCGVSGAQCVSVDLAVHLAAVLLCGNQGILAPLKQLAMTPANMQVCVIAVISDQNLGIFLKINIWNASVGTGGFLAHHAGGHVSSGSTSYGSLAVVS